MAVPDVDVLRSFQADMLEVGFLTGTQAQEDMAWSLAWGKAEDYLHTNILTGTVADERHVWPRGWLDYGTNFRFVQLEKTHVISVVTATLVHDLGTCTCTTDDVSACTLLYRPRAGEIEFRSSEASVAMGCGCVACNREAYLDVTYVAGLYDEPGDVPDTVKMALALMAKNWKGLLESSGAAAGDALVDQWSSMDYSERRGLQRRGELGSSAEANRAEELLRGLRVKRMVALRGRPSVTG